MPVTATAPAPREGRSGSDQNLIGNSNVNCSRRGAGVELVRDRHKADVVLFEQAEDTGESSSDRLSRSTLYTTTAVQFARFGSGKQPLRRRPFHVRPGEAAVVVTKRQGNPSFAPVALNDGLGGFAAPSTRMPEISLKSLAR